MENKKKKVIVAFSGGVDSSTSSLLLRNKGFDVSAVFMRLTDSPYFKFAEERARKLAESMKIPFSVLDLRKEFKKTIIDYFINGYKEGITPNPCVMCNKEIKFGLFLDYALRNRSDYIATGHYAKTKIKKDGVHIYQSEDSRKDQSYFLWRLNQKQLSKVIFPVGLQTKDVTKKIARENKLASADFPESQEVCFVKQVNREYLEKYIKNKKGKIVDVKGNILGDHDGIYFYTIGQRRGIGLAGGPYWVVSKDIKRNRLVVSLDEKDLLFKEVKFKKVNWISGKSPEFPLKIKSKIRYGHVPSSGTLYKNKVVFDKAQRAATPGQSIVFYKGREMLGGGVIV
ncbi:MAG: tRNA 2-thiouridine(34) synthase MnmA [Candidatus Paceibacterota bacterium]|jgi:tRNA-specific 2-thiouridylase